jgi:hypothetical protein
VIGLLPSQANELADRCKDVNVDLRFVNKDILTPMFPSGTDEVLLFTKFISHSWQSAAFNQFGHDRVHRHAGGLEKAAELVRSLVEGRPGLRGGS